MKVIAKRFLARVIINGNIIRIYHECGLWVKKSAPIITVWNHESCQVIINGDHEGQIFLFISNISVSFFYVLTILFRI